MQAPSSSRPVLLYLTDGPPSTTLVEPGTVVMKTVQTHGRLQCIHCAGDTTAVQCISVVQQFILLCFRQVVSYNDSKPVHKIYGRPTHGGPKRISSPHPYRLPETKVFFSSVRAVVWCTQCAVCSVKCALYSPGQKFGKNDIEATHQ